MKIKDAVELTLERFARKNSPTSLPTNRSHGKAIVEYWGPDTDIFSLTRPMMQGWIDEIGNPRCGRKLASSSVHHEYAFMRSVWNTAEEAEPLSVSQFPFSKIKLPKKNQKKRTILPEVIMRLPSVLSPWDYQPVELAIHTFLRRLEIWNIQIDDVDFCQRDEGNGQVSYGTVRIALGKNGLSRTVPLNPISARILQERVDVAVQNSSRFLFEPYREERSKACCCWFKRVWEKAMKQLGCKGDFHGLRYFGAHTAWKRGARIEAIAKMLGHSNTKETMHYIGVDEESVRYVAQSMQHFSLQPPTMSTESSAIPSTSICGHSLAKVTGPETRGPKTLAIAWMKLHNR